MSRRSETSLRSTRLLSRSLRWAIALACCSGLSYASFTVANALKPVDITIGSGLKISTSIEMDENALTFVKSLPAPRVELVSVSVPKLKHKDIGVNQFVLVDPVYAPEVSAMDKDPTLAPENVTTQNGVITFAEIDEDMGEVLDTHSLQRVIAGDLDIQPVRRILAKKPVTPKAPLAVLATAPKAAPLVAPAPLKKLEVVSVTSPATPLVAIQEYESPRWDQSYDVDRLSYNDLLLAFADETSDTVKSDAEPILPVQLPIESHVEVVPESVQIEYPIEVSAVGGLKRLVTQFGEEPIAVVEPVVTTQAVESNKPAIDPSPAQEGAPLVITSMGIITQVQGAVGPRVPSTPVVAATPTPIAIATPEPTPVATPVAKLESSQSQLQAQSEVTTIYEGVVVEALASKLTPVAGAIVQILGTEWNAITDQNGSFRFENVNLTRPLLPVVISKDGYLTQRIDLKEPAGTMVELISNNTALAVTRLADVGQAVSGSMIVGSLNGNETSAGFTVELYSLVEPQRQPYVAYYADADGVFAKNLRATSRSGLFGFFNIVAGTYVAITRDAKGFERAPHLIQIGENQGLARKFALGTVAEITGTAFNASYANAGVDNAKIQLLGSTTSTITDKKGRFVLGPVYVDCTDINYLQMERAEGGFYRNRFEYTCENKAVALYAQTQAFVDGAALGAGVQLDPGHGLMVGHVGLKRSVKAQLWGPDEFSPLSQAGERGKDFYFEKNGILKPTRNRTSGNGNFVIFDAPSGLSYLQLFDMNGATIQYTPVFFTDSTVNVHIQY